MLKVELDYAPEHLQDDDDGVWSVIELIIGAVVSTEKEDSYLAGVAQMLNPESQKIIKQLIEEVKKKVADETLFRKSKHIEAVRAVSPTDTVSDASRASGTLPSLSERRPTISDEQQLEVAKEAIVQWYVNSHS